MVAGTSYTHHSQLSSKKNLFNEKVAKEPKSSQKDKYKFWSQLLLKRAKFLFFRSKKANLATLMKRAGPTSAAPKNARPRFVAPLCRGFMTSSC